MTTGDLVGSLRLDLRADGETAFPYFPAGSLHAALHRGIETVDPVHAHAIHDAPDKPFALSPLYRSATGEPVVGAVAAGERVHAWLATLETRTLAALLTFLGPCPVLHLERVAYAVEGVAPSAPPASAVPPLTTYPALRAAAPATELTLRFLSPTVFRNQGRELVRPDARLVFYSFLRRWEAFSDAPLPGVSRDSLGACVHLLDSRTEQARVALGRFEQAGFTGWARYRVGGGEAFRTGVAALADYAAYCGTGARTALGLGRTERVR